MNEIEVSNCMQQYLSNTNMNGGLYNSTGIPTVVPTRIPLSSRVQYRNGDISMGVL